MGVTGVNPQGCKLNLQCCRPLVLGTLDREDFLGLGMEKGQLVNFGRLLPVLVIPRAGEVH